MNKALAILMGALLVVTSACGIIPQKQYVTEADIVTADGVTIPAGTPIFVDAEGNPTPEDTGTPLLEDDVEKVESLAASAEKGANSLPWFGGLIGLVVGVAGTAAVSGLRKKRAADRAKVDEKLKGKPKA